MSYFRCRSILTFLQTYLASKYQHSREENTILGILSAIGFQITNWEYLIQFGFEGLFYDSALPDTEIPNPQLDIVPNWRFDIPNGDNMLNRGYFLLGKVKKKQRAHELRQVWVQK